MFAIAFDLVVSDTEKHHPKGVSQAYTDIGGTLIGFGFRRVQGSVYVTDTDNMANLFEAIMALKALSWFPASVRDIRAFRIEQWSDFTPIIKKSCLYLGLAGPLPLLELKFGWRAHCLGATVARHLAPLYAV